MKYLHKASDAAIEKLFANHATIADLKKEYKEPDWCNYGPAVLHGMFGCWSLMDLKGLRKRISPKYCRSCPCYTKKSKAKK